MSRRIQARVGIGLLSVAGTAAGHFLTYLIAAPDSHHREELLEATGHAGESPFLIVCAAAFLATCIAILARGRSDNFSMHRAFGRLAFMQTSAFLGLEVVERLTTHVSLREAAVEPVVWMGIAVQILIALAGVFVLKTLRVAATTSSLRPPLPAGTIFLLPLDLARAPIVRGHHRLVGARAPPESS